MNEIFIARSSWTALSVLSDMAAAYIVAYRSVSRQNRHFVAVSADIAEMDLYLVHTHTHTHTHSNIPLHAIKISQLCD